MPKNGPKVLDINPNHPAARSARAMAKVRHMDAAASERMDGWTNLVTGMGTMQDKKKFSRSGWDVRTPQFFEDLYAGDYMSSRIVNLVVDDALRKWVDWTGVEAKETKLVDERCELLDVKGAIERTWKWARAFGGACTYIVTDTDDPASPLEEGETVIGLRDLSRYDLRILTTDVETDFGSPNWAHPNIYYLVVQVGSVFKGYPIHWTRMVRFDGYLLPRRTFIRNNYWHDSVLNRCYSAIQDYHGGNDSAASIMADFNVGIYKMKNLANLVSAGKEKIVKNRVELINYCKSTIRAILLDSDEEEFEDMSRSVEGLADLLTKSSNRLVAATDIPHTKLLGESPDGSNATGNSTTQQWYDHVQSEQENYLRPRMKRIMSAVFPGMPELGYTFRPLYQMTDPEKADVRLKTAQTDQVYLERGVLDPSEVADSRFGGDEYSMDTKLDEEARAMGLIAPGAGPDDEPDPDDGGGRPSNESSEASDKPDSSSKDDPKARGDDDGLARMGGERAPGSAESENPGTAFDLRNTTIPGREKVKQLISQTMSEPMRDPRTDPKVRQGGIPNKPRVIAPSIGNGITAPSGGQSRTDSGVEATMKEFAKGTLRSGSGAKVTDPKQAAAIGYSEQRRGDEEAPKQVASIVVRSGNRLLMGQRRDGGKWTLPGGHMDMGESSIAGALRELREETGIVAKTTDLNLVGCDLVDTPTGKVMVSTFVMDSAQRPTTGKLDPDSEVDKWRWVDVKKDVLAPAVANELHHNPNVALARAGIKA